MKYIHAVLGMNYGDEGKGLVVDYLSDKYSKDAAVLRTQSGPQAAHTVWSSHKSHVFSHYGSGTLRGVPTYFDKRFVVNPIAWRMERDELKNKFGVTMGNTYHGRCLITTPFDVMRNRITEAIRKEDDCTHSSCGMGIFETMKRKWLHSDDVSLYAWSDIHPETSMMPIMHFLDWYEDVVPIAVKNGARLHSDYLGIDFSRCASMWKYFEEAWMTFKKENKFLLNVVPHDKDVLIFENAQGLCLDMDNIKDFPYLTPSNTDLTTIIESLKYYPMQLDHVPLHKTLHLVTRSYATRHGKGPFEDILDVPNDWSLRDSTNNTNTFQGPLRIGKLNIDLMRDNIVKLMDKGWADSVVLHVNFSDQTNDEIITNKGNYSVVDFITHMKAAIPRNTNFDFVKHRTHPHCLTPITLNPDTIIHQSRIDPVEPNQILTPKG